MKVVICLAVCAALFATGETNGVRHGVHVITGDDRVPAGQAQPIPYQPTRRPPPQPRRNNQAMELVRRFLYAQVILNLIKSMTATTTAAAPDPTTATVAPTTADTCSTWPSANGCKYQLFAEKLVWKAARDKCKDVCGSVLAHKNIRTAAQVTELLNAVKFPTGQKAWVYLNDPDSFGGSASPVWNAIDSAAALGFQAGDYNSAVGTAGCGYVAPNLARQFMFDTCEPTSATSPGYYICEVCTP